MTDQKTGRSKGGIARAAKLTPRERSAIAKKAAEERWSNKDTKLLKALYFGDIELGGIKIPCAVLDDGTRVLRERSIAKALGKRGSGHHWAKKKSEKGALLPEYISAKNLSNFIEPETRKKLLNPISYTTTIGTEAQGYPATLLPDICNIWLNVREKGALHKSQEATAKKAEILMRGLAHIGIIALVDEATGYQEVRTQDALQKYLEKFISKELAVWTKKFPDEFYENIYKIRSWTWPGMSKNRYSVVAHYTRDLIYERLGVGLLEELERKTPKDDRGNRKNRMHQWLTVDIGVPALSNHIHSIVMLQRLAISNGYGWKRFVGMVDKVLTKKGDTLPLPFSDND
jgi:hypothetical protein